MSGGFFRGTSADQDTRFSNKQAKLMKSQKFAPELENLVDITKVKMDVMRPWIAHRVTELLGFEDEVLINFIYGLLDGKLVNGKEIQISLTGFMEKNTGKFMKELWTLLLSAEKNVSGVPQQFLDAKEEETRKKKVETDRITHEIQKRKEKEAQDFEEEKGNKMDGKVEDSSRRANYDASDTALRRHPARDSSKRLSADEKKANERNSSRGRIRGTPSRSNSGSFSNSRSRSDEKHRSRSISRSPMNRRSVSSERVHHSPLRRSSTPQRRGSPRRFSPSRRRSHYRQKSISPPGRRSPSPIGRRVRSPVRRRSRSPVGCRSRSPVRRRSRSPVRRRSRSPVRRRSRSPVRRRSRSPIRRRSRTPVRRRSRTLLRNRRSPVRYRSRSPVQYRSQSPVRRRSRSPVRRRSPFPVRRRSPSPARRRSPSPFRRQHQRPLSSPRHRSPSPIQHRSALPSHRSPASPGSRFSSPRDLSSQSPDQASNVRDRRLPKRQSSPVEPSQNRIRTQDHHSPGNHSIPRDIIARTSGRNSSRRGVPSSTPSPYSSPSGSESPLPSRLKSLGEHRRANSPYESLREPAIEDVKPTSPRKSKLPTATPVSPHVEKAHVSSKVEDAKNRSSGEELLHLSASDELKLSAQKARNNVKGSGREELEAFYRVSGKNEEKNDQGSTDSNYGASDKHRAEIGEKRKHKRSKRQESDDYSSDSQLEGRKESKRRRKEEKRMRKEERRRKREERRRRKDKKRAEKIKQKSIGSVSPPSELEENHDGYNSDRPRVARRDSHSSDNEDESAPKKLEIALRKKALESLRAKKGAGH